MTKWCNVRKREIDGSNRLRNRGEYMNMILMWGTSVTKWWGNKVRCMNVKIMNKWNTICKRGIMSKIKYVMWMWKWYLIKICRWVKKIVSNEICLQDGKMIPYKICLQGGKMIANEICSGKMIPF
jgi:hypothetical protein